MTDKQTRRKFLKGSALGATATVAALGITSCSENKEAKEAKEQAAALEQQLDAAQKKITELSSNVVNLQEVLIDRKARGAFGEVQLSALIRKMDGKKRRA